MLRAPAIPTVTSASATDPFNHAAGNLATKVLPLGGTWTEEGDATNFALNTTSHWVERSVGTDSTFGGRFGLAGSTTYTNISVQADVSTSNTTFAIMGVVARYTDTNNYLRLLVDTSAVSPSTQYLTLYKKVASVVTLVADIPLPSEIAANEWWTLRLVVLTSGNWFVYQGAPASIPTLRASGNDPVLATGGALATGKVGIHDLRDLASSPPTRRYDNFLASVPRFDAVLYPNQSAELRTSGIVREDTDGTAYARMESVIGCLPRLPPSGLENRKVELYIKASRGDFGEHPDTGIDDISAQAFYRPAWLLTPGA